MTFEQFEKQLLKNKKFREIAAKSEPEYQLGRMTEDKMNDLTITDNDAIILTLNSPALAC